jgi:hypothetical protein
MAGAVLQAGVLGRPLVDKWRLSACNRRVIRGFQHSGLKKMYDGNPSRVATTLAALDAAASPLELAIPSYRLHELKGSEEGGVPLGLTGALHSGSKALMPATSI